MASLQTLTLASAFFGAVGSGFIFFGSYAFEPRQGAVWGSEAVTAENARITQRNRVRLLAQRCGMAFLAIAFVFQGISAFAPG